MSNKIDWGMRVIAVAWFAGVAAFMAGAAYSFGAPVIFLGGVVMTFIGVLVTRDIARSWRAKVWS